MCKIYKHKLKYIYLMIIWSLMVGLWAYAPTPLLAEAPQEATTPLACTDGTQDSGALYRICVPDNWNNELVIYAHGYVPASNSLAIPGEFGALSFALNLDAYAVATSSYQTNGLAILPGMEDLIDLVEIFKTQEVTPTQVYLIGFSEGGIIANLLVERHTDIFDGGVAGCGPISDFQLQLDYITHFRLVFDYFFPGLMPGDPLDVPQSLIDDWSNHYNTTIKPVVTDEANADKVEQLLRITRAPYDLSNANQTIYDALRYGVIGTNDIREKLGGSPFDNQTYVYAGSTDDEALNAAIPRYTADAAALTTVAQHQSTGVLTIPLVTMHTTFDAIVPYWHEPLYRSKVIGSDNIALHRNYTYDRYGHCNFQDAEILTAFADLVDMVKNPPAYVPVTKIFLPLVIKPTI